MGIKLTGTKRNLPKFSLQPMTHELPPRVSRWTFPDCNRHGFFIASKAASKGSGHDGEKQKQPVTRAQRIILHIDMYATQTKQVLKRSSYTKYHFIRPKISLSEQHTTDRVTTQKRTTNTAFHFVCERLYWIYKYPKTNATIKVIISTHQLQ